MTRLGFDSFNRANQTSASGIAQWNATPGPDDGQSWSVLTGSPNTGIASNEGTITGTASLVVVALGSGISTDCEGIVRLANTANADSVFIVLRCSANGTTRYHCRLVNNAFTMQKVVSGASTTLASTSFTTTAGAFYSIRFRIVGTALTGKVWATGTAEPNTWQLSTTDSSIASGQIGLGCTLNAAGNTASFDGFYVVDYVWADAIPATDSFSVVDDTTPGFVESLIANDSLSIADGYGVTDALTVADTFAGAGGFSPVDNLSVIDSFSSVIIRYRTTPFTTVTLKRNGVTMQTGIAVQIDNMQYAEAADLGGSSPHDSYWVYAEGPYTIGRGDLLVDEIYTDPKTLLPAVYRVFGQTELYGLDHVELPSEKVVGL